MKCNGTHCETCKHYQIDIEFPGDMVCTNRESEHYAEWVNKDDTCNEHGERNYDDKEPKEERPIAC